MAQAKSDDNTLFLVQKDDESYVNRDTGEEVDLGMFDIAPDTVPTTQPVSADEASFDVSQTSIFTPPPSVPTLKSEHSTFNVSSANASVNSSMRLSNNSILPHNSTSNFMEDHVLACLDPGKV